MLFANLTEKLEKTFKKLRGQGKIKETDIIEAMRDVRVALLEADVNFKVVKDFITSVRERVTGQEVLESLSPVQHIIKIVNEELTDLLGGTQSKISISSKPPTIIMMVGLQGSGKTTTSGKLAGYLKKQGKSPLLVAADIYRPAAVKQLQIVGEQLGIPVFEMGVEEKPTVIVKEALKEAFSKVKDVVIIDTAGRLHIDEILMQELKDIKGQALPHEILLVVDAMTGQDAVNVAETFNNNLGIDGVIMTKLDGDARGGAALSVKSITGKPIKFIGMGEKLDAIEPFYPERMASRILGMGDMLSLIEKIEDNIDLEKAAEMEKKLRKERFTLDDFLDQLQQIKKMGSLSSLLKMIPGMGKIANMQNVDLDSVGVKHTEAIVYSMTKKERNNPNIINGSRRKRIAQGAGRTVQEVNRLLKQFEEAKKMMKRMNNQMNKPSKKNAHKGNANAGFDLAGMLGGGKFPF